MFLYTEIFKAVFLILCFLYEKHFLQKPNGFRIPGIIPPGKEVPKVYKSICQNIE